jgi:DNA-binding MarR family transcriptional regulator
MSTSSRSQDSNATSGDSGARTAAGDAFSWFAFQVLRLSGLLTEAGDRLAEPAGQSSARWQVLAAIEEEPSSVADIARNLGLARQSVQRVADVLEREGYTTYEENPKHRRAKLLRLTRTGRASLRSIQVAQRAWANEVGRSLEIKDLRRASEVLARVTELVEGGVRKE